MAQQRDLELPMQGNPHAIANLINRSLQPKGITAKAVFKDDCLQVMLEAAQVPDQQAVVAFIYKEIIGLGAESIKTAKVYGRRIGEEFPAWSQQVQLLSPPQALTAESGLHSSLKTEVPPRKIDLKDQARNGDLEALAKLLTTALEPHKTTLKLNLKDGCLKLLIESESVPDDNACVEVAREALVDLKPEFIKEVKLYGRQTGEELPSWNREFELLVTVGESKSTITQAESIYSASNSGRVPLAFAQSVKSLHERTGTRVLDCINALRVSNGDINIAAQLLKKLNQLPVSQDSTQPIQPAVVPTVTLSPTAQNSLRREEGSVVDFLLLLRKADDLKLVYMNLLKEGLIASKVNEFDINGISDSIQTTLDARYQQAKEEYQKLKDTTTVYFDLVNEAKGKKIARSAKL